ncbi:alpha/beta hydrolase family protein [Synoicihabitans lomoniglobus]|uniref:Prolyl oligopeptidase family serine peptidase n=1 Tax=Synoicihabitans lomoniglobus TaxID=2909285 RepID=A0AAF0CN63_9BACT|nr:prolyl oligopeptidase family serine peptidase [Opitutaceae bacterium LMO-M01]WED64025.1 prolyl oligopeptidase family serine peptidase [Opitutaceae bacterium LMO-M01]
MISFPLFRRVVQAIACAFWGTTLLEAADELDLDRLEPVAADQPVPIQDFFRPSYFSSPILNPAGTHVAALVSGGQDKYRLVVVDLATNQTEMLSGIGDLDTYGHRWLDDRRLVFSLAAQKYWGIALCAAEVGSMSRPYPLIQNGRHTVISVPVKNRRYPYVWVSGEGKGKDGGIVDLNTDIKTGKIVDLTRATFSSSDFFLAEEQNRKMVKRRFAVPEGGLIAGYFSDRFGELAYSYTGHAGLYTLHQFKGEDWDPTPVDMERVDILAAGDESGTLLIRDRVYDGQPSAIRVLEPATGKMGEPLLRDKGYDVTDGAFRDAATHRIVGFQYDRATPAAVWFDEGYQALDELFKSYFPRKAVRIVSGNETNTVFVLLVYTDREPASYYVVDLEKRSLGLLKASRPWIDPQRSSGVSIVKFKTAEGKKLDAYLTMPAGVSKANPAALVVLPHGGPWVRDRLGFDGQAQFLASRGYAVLQPNYRGSTGYDWMFPEEDQWAFRKMHDDVTAATKTVLRTGLVDPKRVAIMGGSFGAYLALSGGVHEPDLYKCVVGMAGVYDWAEVIKDREYDQYFSPFYGRLRRKLGNPDDDREKFKRISPIHFVENMRAPMFLAHGKDDPVASVLESKRLEDQLKKHGVPHEALYFALEGHGMGHLDNQVELYTRIENFLARNL